MFSSRQKKSLLFSFFCLLMLLQSCRSFFLRVAAKSHLPRVASLSMSSDSRPRALIPVADGTEEIEAVTIIDTLVRAGVDVKVASVMESGLQVVCSRGVKLVADTMISDCAAESYDVIVCPGGMPGATNLRDSDVLTSMLKQQFSSGKYIAAICAAPAVVFSHHGFTAGRSVTGYPAPQFKEKLDGYVEDKVVVDGNIITSQGPGTALAFALQLVHTLVGAEKATALAKEMLH